MGGNGGEGREGEPLHKSCIASTLKMLRATTGCQRGSFTYNRKKALLKLRLSLESDGGM